MISSTPLPGSGGGSGPAYDDTAVRERLDVVERNRSVGDPVVAEIVSVVDVDADTTFSDLGLFYVDVQLSDGTSTAYVSGYDLDPILETFAAAVAGTGLTATLRNGRLVVTSSTGSLTVTTASSYDFERLFPRPVPGYGIPIIARPGTIYDTDAAHVRAPETGLPLGTGEGIDTALRALHAADTRFASVVEPILRIRIPDGVASADYDVTVADLGLVGHTLFLSAYDGTGATPGSQTQTVTLSDGAATMLSVAQGLAFDDGSGQPYFGVEVDGTGRRILLRYPHNGANNVLAGPDGVIALIGSAADVLGYPFADGADALYSADQIRMLGGSRTVESYLAALVAEIASLRARVASLETLP